VRCDTDVVVEGAAKVRAPFTRLLYNGGQRKFGLSAQLCLLRESEIKVTALFVRE